jgi:simple sugar transport system permease protein
MSLDTIERTPSRTEAEQVETSQKRRQRISTGVLIAVVGVLLLIGLVSTTGSARFALSDAFDEVQLPTVILPGFTTVLVSGLLCLAAAVGYLSGQLRGRWPVLAGAVAGLAVIVGFLTWAASGRELPFPVSNQFAGTLSLATPLVFGALCGVLCERSGVVNYLVNQVVLGVVLNLLAVGVTGFLFDQLVQPASSRYNSAPVLEPIPIPGLSKIPFFGRVLFEQNVLAYLGAISVALVWLVLYRTTWGLRIRAVGEHPEAADTVGISVRGIRWSAVLAGGIFGGLGGSFFTLASTGSFTKEFTVGNGFIALAAVIMGRWHPVLASIMCLFFGFVTQMASQLQTLSTPMPSQFLLILPYVATIIAVAGLVGRVRPPAADGIPYEK